MNGFNCPECGGKGRLEQECAGSVVVQENQVEAIMTFNSMEV